jgi:hypothetical protein
VVIAWEDEVHIIGPKNAAAKYFYDGRVHLIAGMYCFASKGKKPSLSEHTD